MNQPKKSNKWIVVALIFFVIAPVVTVLFSKVGLDRFKAVRSELSLLPDSINLPLPPSLQPEDSLPLSQKARIVHFMQGPSNTAYQQTLQQLQRLQKALPKEDVKRWYIVSYLRQDSSTSQLNLLANTQRDTATWKVLYLPAQVWDQQLAAHRIETQQVAPTLSLITAQNILARHYLSNQEADFSKIAQHLAIVIPKKERQSIEYKAEKDPYK